MTTLRSKMIHLATTLPKSGRERTALLKVLASGNLIEYIDPGLKKFNMDVATAIVKARGGKADQSDLQSVDAMGVRFIPVVNKEGEEGYLHLEDMIINNDGGWYSYSAEASLSSSASNPGEIPQIAIPRLNWLSPSIVGEKLLAQVKKGLAKKGWRFAK